MASEVFPGGGTQDQLKHAWISTDVQTKKRLKKVNRKTPEPQTYPGTATLSLQITIVCFLCETSYIGKIHFLEDKVSVRSFSCFQSLFFQVWKGIFNRRRRRQTLGPPRKRLLGAFFMQGWPSELEDVMVFGDVQLLGDIELVLGGPHPSSGVHPSAWRQTDCLFSWADEWHEPKFQIRPDMQACFSVNFAIYYSCITCRL